jgi:predicted NBD/HSP70 family sugar kinase
MVVVPSKMGRLNKRALLARLQVMGTASRARLAKSMGLSQPTVGKIVEELLDLGVLEETELEDSTANGEETRSVLGRPGRMVRLNQSQPRFVGIQLGVSETSLASLPVGTSKEDSWQVTVPTPGSATLWLDHLRKAATKIRRPKDLWGVLVSVPGIVDEEKSKVLFSPNLHWTEGAALTALIRKLWDVPVALVQEERALALGQQAVVPNDEGFLLVDFGEGVGGAVIIGGKLHLHPLPMSGELGHTPVLGNKRPCGCGALGCLETLVSTRGLLQTFAANVPQASPNWLSLVSFLELEGLAPWLVEALDATAAVIAGALNVFGLRHVVITGTLTELPPAVFRYLSGAIVRGAMWGRFGRVEVDSAPRRRTAGLVAVAIDRLVIPMTDKDRHQEGLLTTSFRRMQE